MYSRETELRHLQPNDVYKLGVILDDNGCWKKLMEIIPKDLYTQTDYDSVTESHQFKYNNDHISLIECAFKRPGESRLHSQILFEEWGTSGRKHERPTIGALLQLLIKAELFRAADFVSINFLKEPPPERPQNGPAARIDISLTDDLFDDIKDVINDSSFYPGTETLNENANRTKSMEINNIDRYTKYQRSDKSIIMDVNAPKPPPRTTRSARLQLQQKQQNLQQKKSDTEATTIEANNQIINNEQLQNQQRNSFEIITLTTQNIPKFSALITDTSETNLSSEAHTESTNLSEAPIPMISILALNTATSTNENTKNIDDFPNDTTILPATIISALNLSDEFGSATNYSISSRGSSLSNDSDMDSNKPSASSANLINKQDAVNHKNDTNDEHGEGDFYDNDDEDIDEDNSLPNLSIFEQRSSNNDSSLTTVTGTSGENSFDLTSNDCSSASNDENIPCLSALK